jgi:hypothetical protein
MDRPATVGVANKPVTTCNSREDAWYSNAADPDGLNRIRVGDVMAEASAREEEIPALYRTR